MIRVYTLFSEVMDMRDYTKGLRRYVVTITAGLEHTATTFTEAVLARNVNEARHAMERKWSGAAIGAVDEAMAVDVPGVPFHHGCKQKAAK